MNPATLDATLRELGSAPVGAADLDALEARLFDAIGASPPAPAGRRKAAPVLIGAVAACLLALVVLAVGWFAAADDQYVLAAAVDVEVVLPDGEVVEGAAGLVLPVGSVVNVRGSMEIAGVVYGPGDYVITADGPVATAGAADGGIGPDPRVDAGDGGGAPVTSTTAPVRPGVVDDGGGPTTTSRPPAGGAVPPATDRPVGVDLGDSRPTTTTRPARPTTTVPRDPPPTTTTTDPPQATTAPPRDTTATTTAPTTAPRNSPPRDTTTTGPSRDRP